MVDRGGLGTRAAHGFGDGRLNLWIVGELGRRQASFEGRDIGIDRREAVEPMAAEPWKLADGDVLNVDAFGPFGQSGPGEARGAVEFDGFPQRGAVACALVKGIEYRGAKFGG